MARGTAVIILARVVVHILRRSAKNNGNYFLFLLSTQSGEAIVVQCPAGRGRQAPANHARSLDGISDYVITSGARPTSAVSIIHVHEALTCLFWLRPERTAAHNGGERRLLYGLPFLHEHARDNRRCNLRRVELQSTRPAPATTTFSVSQSRSVIKLTRGHSVQRTPPPRHGTEIGSLSLPASSVRVKPWFHVKIIFKRISHPSRRRRSPILIFLFQRVVPS